MPYINNPIENPLDYDSIEIGGIDYGGSQENGMVIVDGQKRPFGWDIKKGKGVKGATLTLNEFPPSEFTITFVMWLPNHFIMAQQIVDNFDYDPAKKTSQPQDVYHPDLARLSINSIVAKEIGQIKKVDKGLYNMAISVIEYAPPPKTNSTATPNSSATNADPNKPGATNDPVADAQQKQIALLMAQAKGQPPPPNATLVGNAAQQAA